MRFSGASRSEFAQVEIILDKRNDSCKQQPLFSFFQFIRFITAGTEQNIDAYFGNGILIKDSGTENIYYKDIKSGFDRMFDSFGKKSDSPYDLYEIIVQEGNIEYVLASLEKIYEKADQIMDECYDEIYKELVEFLNGTCDDCLKDDFTLEYLKENWNVYGIAIYDDYVEFTIGVDAAKDPENDSDYNITIIVDFATLKPEASFNVVW